MTQPIEPLSNPPLIEAIFELKWGPHGQPGTTEVDPHAGILPGRLYERLKDEYPFHEKLPAASIPEQMASHIVQHRFRVGEGAWPVVQVGPGVVTLNETPETYTTWAAFHERLDTLVRALFDVHPMGHLLPCSGLHLRYMNAVPFTYEDEDVLKFLRTNMRVELRVPESLFEEGFASPSPQALDSRLTFPCKKPTGLVHLRFARAELAEGGPALYWETSVQSLDDDVPDEPEPVIEWASEAHVITEGWFFRLVEGPLLKEFT